MLYGFDAASCWVHEQIFGAVYVSWSSWWGKQRGTHKVSAMPPVARIPQRIVLGSDIFIMASEFVFERDKKRELRFDEAERVI